MVRCCVPGCKNTSKTTRTHVLPRDSEIRKKWCEALNRSDLLNSEDRNRHKFRVCDIHFAEDAKFPVLRNRTNIKFTAVPTLYLGGKIVEKLIQLELPENTQELKLSQLIGTAASCEKRWKSICDNYCKQNGQAIKVTGSACPGKRKRSPTLDQLGFLGEVEHERRLLTINDNIEIIHSQEHADESNESVETYEDVVNLNSLSNDSGFPLNKKKEDLSSEILKAINQSSSERENLLKGITAIPSILPSPPAPPEDEIDMLFRSLATTMKSFPPLLRTQTKIKIFQIISAAEMQLLHPQSPS